MDRETPIETSHPLLSQSILHDTLDDLAAGHGIRTVELLDLQFGLDGVDRVQNALANG